MTRPRRTVTAAALLPAALLILAVFFAASADAGTSPPVTPIRHFIVLLQENHSFDNYFGTYPGADGIPAGASVPKDPARGGAPAVSPFHIGNRPIVDLDHNESSARIAIDGGRMDGFVKAQTVRGGTGRWRWGTTTPGSCPSTGTWPTATSSSTACSRRPSAVATSIMCTGSPPARATRRTRCPPAGSVSRPSSTVFRHRGSHGSSTSRTTIRRSPTGRWRGWTIPTGLRRWCGVRSSRSQGFLTMHS